MTFIFEAGVCSATQKKHDMTMFSSWEDVTRSSPFFWGWRQMLKATDALKLRYAQCGRVGLSTCLSVWKIDEACFQSKHRFGKPSATSPRRENCRILAIPWSAGGFARVFQTHHRSVGLSLALRTWTMVTMTISVGFSFMEEHPVISSNVGKS